MTTKRVDLNSLSDDYIECRVDGHDWEKIPYDGSLNPKKWRPSTNLIVRQKRCTRCHSCKYEYWNAITGAIIVRPYIKYEKGYTRVSGVTKQIFRREFLQRNLDEPKMRRVK